MNPLLFTSLMSYLHMEQAYGHSLNQTASKTLSKLPN